MMLTRKVFNEGIEELTIIYPELVMDKKKAEIWYKYSSDLEDNIWKRKIRSCIKFVKKTPTLADILDLKNQNYADEGVKYERV